LAKNSAVYARKSNDDQQTEPNRSVVRQVAHAKQYTQRKGWAVLDQHVYTDDGISGGEFKNRPGLLRLLNALKPAPPFDAVIMMEASRLGRDRLSTELVARDLFEAGVKIYYYLDDTEERLDTPEHRFVMAARGFAAEMEREKAKQRTRDALLARAKLGRVTGGVVFGYRNVPVHTGSDASGNPLRAYVQHEIEPAEAAIVRGIFQMYADGFGLKKITKTLNGDPGLGSERQRYFAARRVPPPRKGSGSWAPSCIDAILKRERYRGRITWGRFRNTDKGGRTRVRARQPADQWVAVDMPELRIVSDDLWDAAQARRCQHSQVREGARQQRGATAPLPTPRTSASLLSGLAICTACGGPITMSGSGKRTQCYGCSYYRNRGATVCSNTWLEAIPAVDHRLLEEIERTVLTPEARRYTLAQAAGIVRERLATRPDRLPGLRSDLAKIKREIENLLRALESGRAPDVLVERLAEKEEIANTLAAEVTAIERSPSAKAFDPHQLDRVLAEHLGRFGEMLRGDVIKARQALQKLLVDRVRFTPITLPDGQRTDRLEAELTLGRILTAEVNHKVHVPDGICTLLFPRFQLLTIVKLAA
jgi:DNA invertase Pin-like site-specific DNA recombinase